MKKKETNYFDMFAEAAMLCDDTCDELEKLFDNIGTAGEAVTKIHDYERKGDELRHVLFAELSQAFITPIDRDDIVLVSSLIENVLDSLDEISLLIDRICVTKTREGAKEFMHLINDAATAMVNATKEFKNFKKSTEFSKFIIEVNKIEEDGDALFSNLMKKLFTDEKDPIEIIRWKAVFEALENALDSMEDVCDAMERVVINNC